ncbi:hypothetical protein OE88DRAFT_9634 [Heliocybe sulcata]|uniref:Uncharacterized protein n=1 Tax=Heliocybe sulcata TaxID=5364 RepID=A0A5C3NHP7_9AGAM|nr:hypothetical protein OE88DRAFT_9634 [Heliocybe sulcata]
MKRFCEATGDPNLAYTLPYKEHLLFIFVLLVFVDYLSVTQGICEVSTISML